MAYTPVDPAIQATRKDWRLTTWADAFGVWHARIASDAGWGNVYPHHIESHMDAMRSRARRAIRKEISARQGHQVWTIQLVLDHIASYGDGIIYAVTFAEKTV